MKNVEFKKLVDVGLNDYGYRKTLGWVWKVQVSLEEMVFGGGVDKKRNIHIAHVIWSKSLGWVISSTRARHLSIAQKGIANIFSTLTTKTQIYTFPFDLATHGSIAHVRYCHHWCFYGTPFQINRLPWAFRRIFDSSLSQAPVLCKYGSSLPPNTNCQSSSGIKKYCPP